MADSAKPILVAGAVAGVALLGAAWIYAASNSRSAERDAIIRAEALNARHAVESGASSTQPVQVAAVETQEPEPAPEPETAEEPAEAAEAEAEPASEAEPEKADEPAETATAEPEPEPETAEEPAETAAAESEPAAEPEPAAEAEPEKAEEPAETEMAAATAESGDAPAEEEPAEEPAAVASTGGDVEAGKKVFRKCKACHMVGDNAKNRVGPVLNGIVGHTKGAVEDFKYSKVFEEANAAGEVWTQEALDAYLENPKAAMKGTKMAFAGLRKEDDRANVIAYLASFE